jgi:beta-lactamase class D
MELRRCVGLIGLMAVLHVPAANAGPDCTVIADTSSGRVLKQQGDACEQRLTPASTFKIAISLMGYDSGYLVDEHLPALPFYQGYPDWIPEFKATTDPTRWIAQSVVWYSQRITEWLGPDRFRRYVSLFNYGNVDVSGNPGQGDGLTQAWLTSSLKISALEQVAFLEKLVNRQLPVSAKAYAMTARITALGSLPTGWEVHGKTGTGFRLKIDGTVDTTRQVGWFVGWAAKGTRQVVFARCVQDDTPQPDRAGLRVRSRFMQELPELLGSR